MSPDFDSQINSFCILYLSAAYDVHVFNPNITGILHHTKVLLTVLLNLTIALSNALVISNLRRINSKELKTFEHPLKIMLMLLGFVVEISKQYSSK